MLLLLLLLLLLLPILLLLLSSLTGIHIENFSFPASRNFLRRWRKENRDSPLPALAVQSYDAVAVLEAAFASILQQRPGMLKAGASSSGGGGGAGRFGRKGQLYCDMSPDSVQVII